MKSKFETLSLSKFSKNTLNQQEQQKLIGGDRTYSEGGKHPAGFVYQSDYTTGNMIYYNLTAFI